MNDPMNDLAEQQDAVTSALLDIVENFVNVATASMPEEKRNKLLAELAAGAQPILAVTMGTPWRIQLGLDYPDDKPPTWEMHLEEQDVPPEIGS